MQEGDYLFSHVGFSPSGMPQLSLQQNRDLVRFNPLGQTLTLKFDTSQRFCRGWHSLETGQDSPCPDNQIVDHKYDQCSVCQKRTGFNPAFYHASSVSPQQEARNLEPHFLYLAYFSDDLIKVGISHAKRGNARLLEQGARSAVVLDTFPTAHIARQYEAKIAALAGIYETVQLAKKITLLNTVHDKIQAAGSLQTTRRYIEQALNVSFSRSDVEHFDATYFPDTAPQLSDMYNCMTEHQISGEVRGMLGSLLFCQHKDSSVFLPLKKYTGYRFILTSSIAPLNIPAQQTSLF